MTLRPLALPLLFAAGLFVGHPIAARDLGCSCSPAVTQAIEDIRTSYATCLPHLNCWLGKLDAAEHLIEQFPEDVHAHRYYQDVAAREQTATDSGPIGDLLEEQYRELLAKHPDDPLFLYLSGRWNDDRDQVARAAGLDPTFAWPRLWLADFKMPDADAARAAAVQDLETFLRLCPDRVGEAVQGASRQPEAGILRAQLPALRRAIEAAPRRIQVEQLSQLWSAEFKATPPADHEAVRQGVASDLARLESWPRTPEHGSPHDWTKDEAWWQLRHHGYELVGNPGALEQFDAAYARRFPCSLVAVNRLYEGWAKKYDANKGFDAVPAAGWTEAAHLFDPASDRCPNEYRFMSLRFQEAARLEPPVSDRHLTAEAQRFLAGWEQRLRSDNWVGLTPYHDIAVAYLRRGLEPDTVLDLVRRDREESQRQAKIQAEWAAVNAATQSEEMAARLKKQTESTARFFDFDRLCIEAEAQLLAGQQGQAEAALREAARTAPDYVLREPAAGNAASSPMLKDARERYKRVRQRLGLPAESLAPSAEALAQETTPAGGWTLHSDALPEWTLTDLTGRTWRSADLRGKTLLVNVWATWCGPCRAEIPSVKALHERLRGRDDVVLLSFNIDADVGLVEPFAKAQGLTWPILLAGDYMRNFEDGSSVPQTWLVDAGGIRRHVEVGFSPNDTGWVDATLALLDGVASGAAKH